MLTRVQTDGDESTVISTISSTASGTTPPRLGLRRSQPHNPGLDRDDTMAQVLKHEPNVPEDGMIYKVGVHYWQDLCRQNSQMDLGTLKRPYVCSSSAPKYGKNPAFKW